ncbi:MAG: DUF2254 domain-containing protein [Candidatus Eremiobacteraeota bacterium]|nr:DUF2254 domain-containing protein [Candidatus Eremiobacteraeota bacterium]
MTGRLGKLTDALAANLWLIPLIAFLLSFALSRGLLAFDKTVDVSANAWFVYGGSPQGARQLLATIAGSMITFIGLVFSSTILVLQLASSQFSPRLRRIQCTCSLDRCRLRVAHRAARPASPFLTA